MDKFEKHLEQMKIPTREHDPFENRLRSKILEKYFNKNNVYAIRFKYAAALASLLLIFTIFSIINPTVINKLNNYAFNQETESVEKTEVPNQQKENFMRYTSIHNPSLSQKLNPDDFEEDKAYIIRKYTSSTEGSVMIVSEFKNENKKSSRRISY